MCSTLRPAWGPRWPTFGIKLSAAPGTVSEVRDTVSMSWAMLNTMTGFYDQTHIGEAAAAARTIVIDTGTVRATDFDLDREAQDLLFPERAGGGPGVPRRYARAARLGLGDLQAHVPEQSVTSHELRRTSP
jgi:hypothetical protein